MFASGEENDPAASIVRLCVVGLGLTRGDVKSACDYAEQRKQRGFWRKEDSRKSLVS